MLWDSFLFNKEYQILDIRVSELGPVVDGFIIVESPTTHSGKPRFVNEWFPYDYEIKHLVVDLPHKGEVTDEQAAENEVVQRNAISDAINDDDIIILSDVDEIPKREIIEEVKLGTTPSLPFKIKCSTRYYKYNLEGPAPFCEYGPIVAFGYQMKRVTPQMLRACIYSPDMPSVDGGWHFTFVGDVEQKMNDIAHHTQNHRKRYEEVLDNKIEVKINNDLPHCIKNNPGFYRLQDDK